MNRRTRIDNVLDDAPLRDGLVDSKIGVDVLAREGVARAARAIARERRPQVRVGVVNSPLGRLFVASSDRGIAGIHFTWTSSADPLIAKLARRFDIAENSVAAKAVGDAVESIVAGKLDAVDQPVDLAVVESEFQRLTMQKLRQVRAGAVTTYHALAAAIGHPDSQRAVGNTMATNPIAIFIPCHRVIRSDGTIGNYGGGVDRKIMLLRAEGFAMEEQPKLPQGSVLGHSRTHIFCRPECPAARRADPARSLIYADAAKAAAAGLRACKICKPT